MKHLPIYFLLSLALSGCHPNSEFSGWAAVYQHDRDGTPMRGSIDSLISGIRRGYDVRVGWGGQRTSGDSTRTLEHMAEPLFLSIIQQHEISAVIDPHPLLESYIDIEKQQFRDGGHIWNCVLTTTGTFNARVYDRDTGELIRDIPQNHRMTWFLEYPPGRLELKEARPLF